MVNIDFTNLNDIYHLSMILVGFGGLLVSFLGVFLLWKKQKKPTYSSKAYYKKKK